MEDEVSVTPVFETEFPSLTLLARGKVRDIYDLGQYLLIVATDRISAYDVVMSDIPDSGVVQCVIRNYYGLSFPQPEGGIVTVVYPIMFSPG